MLDASIQSPSRLRRSTSCGWHASGGPSGLQFQIVLPDVFGRPESTTACECERSTNRRSLKASTWRTRRNFRQSWQRKPLDLQFCQSLTKRIGNIDELYRLAYSRLPTDAERAASLEYLANRDDQKSSVRGSVMGSDQQQRVPFQSLIVSLYLLTLERIESLK